MSCDCAEIEAIKQLKARYFRFVDTKNWSGLRTVFTDNVTAQVFKAPDAGPEAFEYPATHGADVLLKFVSNALIGALSIHHGHMPEIELLSDHRAKGIWAMEDIVRFPDGSVLHGWGHYHEHYEKQDGAWKIADLKLYRLREEITPAP